MSKAKPLTELHRQTIRDTMCRSVSLAEITRETGVVSVIEFMLEDKYSLEQYMSSMAAALTSRRQQISHRSLLLSMFHYEMAELSLYDVEFKDLLVNTVENERKLQQHVFLAENHLQVDIRNNVWKLYESHGDSLRLKTIDFLKIQSPSLRYEMKYYLQYIFESRGKINAPLFCCQYLALNTLASVNPKIRFFADVTEADAKALVLSLETMKKEDGTLFSQYYIAKAANSVKHVIDYLMSDMRDADLNTPKPHMNPFAIITFHNLRQYNTPTTIIPESMAEQLDRYAVELPSLHKLLYDIFMNTGLRLKEVFFLEEDCVEPSRYIGICQLKFKPHKVLATRRRRGAGDYHRVMIPQELANKLSRYIADTKHIRQTANSSYIFLSQRLGYDTTVMDAQPFIRSVRSIIKKHDICGEDGELWHFTSRQFRKTIAVRLIENGATTAELAY